MKSKSLALFAMLAIGAIVSSTAIAANWTYDGSTITDGDWTFNASVSGTNLTVKEPVDASCPTALTDLDFSKKVVKSDDETVEYTIVELSMNFNSHTGISGNVGKLTLPGEGLATVSRYAFNTCTSMFGDLRFPSTITKIEKDNFYNSKITSVYIAPTTSRCVIVGGYGGGGAFGGAAITNLTIAAGGDVVLETGSVFDACKDLKKADLSGVSELKMMDVDHEANDNYAHFDGCSSLEEVTLGAGLTNMVPVSLFGTSGGALSKVRFLGPPPTRFVTPYLNGIGASQKVTTVVPVEYKNEWKAYAADEFLSTAMSTWSTNYLKSGVSAAMRPLLLDRDDETSAPIIVSVSATALHVGARTALITVAGANLLDGTISITIKQGESEIVKLTGLTSFSRHTVSGLSPSTEYSVVVTAENANGSVSDSSLTFTTYAENATKEAYLLYDPSSLVVAFYYDDVDRTAIPSSIRYVISGASTWGSDKTIRSATQAYFDFSFATYRPTSCSAWFYNFSKLIDIDGIENLDTSECTSFNQMFRSTGFRTLDLSNFKTGKVEDMSQMFDTSRDLATIYANGNFLTNSIWQSSRAFYYCDEPLVGGEGTKYSLSNITADYAHVDDASHGNPGYFTYKAAPTSKASLASVGLSKLGKTTATVRVLGYDLNGGTVKVEVYDGDSCFKSVTHDAYGEFDFDGLSLDKSYPVKVTVTNASGETVDDSFTIKTWGATTKAARAVLTVFDATLTFYYDDVDRSGMATVYAFNKDSQSWSGAASSVSEVVFDRSFRDYLPTTCANWFKGFRGYHNVSVRFTGMKNLNTKNVTSMSCMFYNCAVREDPDLTGFDTRNVTSFRQFCRYGGGWTAIDCSSFDTGNVTDMAEFFYGGCKTIYANEHFVTNKVTSYSSLFGSSSIVGGAGTAYSSEHASDITYARVDDPDNGKPGYFTYKAPPHQGLILFLR